MKRLKTSTIKLLEKPWAAYDGRDKNTRNRKEGSFSSCRLTNICSRQQINRLEMLWTQLCWTELEPVEQNIRLILLQSQYSCYGTPGPSVILISHKNSSAESRMSSQRIAAVPPPCLPSSPVQSKLTEQHQIWPTFCREGTQTNSRGGAQATNIL